MSDFKAKMHQIGFRLGLPHWGSLQRSPRPSSWIWGPTSKGEEGKGEGWEGRGGRRSEGRGGLSGNVAEETFCLKFAPACTTVDSSVTTTACSILPLIFNRVALLGYCSETAPLYANIRQFNRHRFMNGILLIIVNSDLSNFIIYQFTAYQYHMIYPCRMTHPSSLQYPKRNHFYNTRYICT